VATGERIITLDSGSRSVGWSPDGHWAYVYGNNRYQILHLDDGSIRPLQLKDTNYFYYDRYPYWDFERGLLMLSSYGEILAIDIQSGMERLRFSARENERGGCEYRCGYGFSQDRRWIFVYGDESLAVWNIDTLEKTFLPVETGRDGGANISPDGRYLIVARAAVRVWDLWNLPEDFEARTPIAMYGVGGSYVASVRFADNVTLEVVTGSGDGTATTLYDVATGAVR
jgi:hypothetical protein